MSDGLDQFFTSPEEAKYCLSLLDMSPYDLIIEPSAGSGSFSSQIPHCVAYDIEPQNENIIQQNWLLTTQDTLPPYEHLLVVGNPPFGKRYGMARSFIKHSISLGADTIAFVLPTTFEKHAIQRMFPKDWRLVVSERLERSLFFVPSDNKEVHIPCGFYVWTHANTIYPGVNLRKIKQPDNKDFTFLHIGDPKADFCVKGNANKVRPPQEITVPSSEHYIYVNDRNRIEEVKENFKNLPRHGLSGVNGGLSWMNKNDILESYNELTKGHNK